MSEKTVEDVKNFWESTPLFTGESLYPAGSREHFEEHRHVYINDCFAGQIDERIYPQKNNRELVLDLGCGPGFWTIELANNGSKNIIAADLTENALQLTRARAEIFGINVRTSLQNAESMDFEDSKFSHVNCQGVIHHTPDTQACIKEIARVLRLNGTALISVYYINALLRFWPILKYPARILSQFKAGLKGRGRENIYNTAEINELIRLYDGDQNPIGKAYSKQDLLSMLTPYFQVEEVFLHFFPARSLPFSISPWLHTFLDHKLGFMIFAKCRKVDK